MPVSPELRPPLIRSADYLRFYAARARRENRTVTCVQIGANDGVSHDPVHEYLTDGGWRGLLAEPLPDVYQQLLATYRDVDNVRAVNVAIGTVPGDMPFFRIGDSHDSWATGLSSFIRAHVQDHIDRGYVAERAREAGVALPAGDLITEVAVTTVTFEQFLADHGVESFDVLIIDTEGYDYEILKLVDFVRHQPDLVWFESDNLSDGDYQAALDLLASLGYELRWSFLDTLGLRVPYPRRAALGALARDFVPRLRHKVSRMSGRHGQSRGGSRTRPHTPEGR